MNFDWFCSCFSFSIQSTRI